MSTFGFENEVELRKRRAEEAAHAQKQAQAPAPRDPEKNRLEKTKADLKAKLDPKIKAIMNDFASATGVDPKVFESTPYGWSVPGLGWASLDVTEEGTSIHVDVYKTTNRIDIDKLTNIHKLGDVLFEQTGVDHLKMDHSLGAGYPPIGKGGYLSGPLTSRGTEYIHSRSKPKPKP